MMGAYERWMESLNGKDRQLAAYRELADHDGETVEVWDSRDDRGLIMWQEDGSTPVLSMLPFDYFAG